MEQINWFERKFENISYENILPSLAERLEGTPIRLKAKPKKIEPKIYAMRIDGKWSILEHIGHLADLEPLWQGRLDDILHGAKELRPTDLTNRQTSEANHNFKSVKQLIKQFRKLRTTTLLKIKELSEEDVFKSALHPRLKTPMNIINLFTFVAEHDDHHLAKITALAKILLNETDDHS